MSSLSSVCLTTRARLRLKSSISVPGNGVSVLELIKVFEEATGVKVPHKIVRRRAGDIEKVWADPAYANEVLGWKATSSLADTMRSAWAWQLKLRERGVM